MVSPVSFKGIGIIKGSSEDVKEVISKIKAEDPGAFSRTTHNQGTRTDSKETQYLATASDAPTGREALDSFEKFDSQIEAVTKEMKPDESLMQQEKYYQKASEMLNPFHRFAEKAEKNVLNAKDVLVALGEGKFDIKELKIKKD